MNYQEAVRYLLQFTDFERMPGMSRTDPSWNISRMRSLLSRLGNPQDGRRTIHLTGSKGKGSTAAMVASILGQAGYRTGLYTSPHLHSYTERMRLNGESVAPELFGSVIEQVSGAVNDENASGLHGAVTTFEVLTAAAFCLFRQEECEWQMVEVGLGGRFDATNVFASKELAIVTPISLEHTEILGDTEAAIAADKGDIITPGCTAVISAQEDAEALEVLRKRAEEVGAGLVYVPERYAVEVEQRFPWGQSFRLTDAEGDEMALRLPLLGLHMAENAATAVAAIEELRRQGFTVPRLAVENGLSRLRWPGRVEVMGSRPIVVADGAHNAASMRRLCETLRDYFEFDRAFFVLGVNVGKDLHGMGMHISRMAEMIIATRSRNPRAMDPAAIVSEVGFLGPPCVVEESVEAAMNTALGHAREHDLVCATGSLFVAAEARAFILGDVVVEGSHGR